MLVLRGTIDTLKKLGCDPRSIRVSDPVPNLGEWYINTSNPFYGGDLFFVCMHVESLFVILLPVEPDMNDEDLARSFLSHLFMQMTDLGASSESAKRIIQMYGTETLFAKNSKRSLVGYMTSTTEDIRTLAYSELDYIVEDDMLIPHAIEYRINSKPRGCSSFSKNCIFSLQEFWRCLRRLDAPLPARGFLRLRHVPPNRMPQVARKLDKVLPEKLVTRILWILAQRSVLFTMEEMKTILAWINSVAEDNKLVLDLFGKHAHQQIEERMRKILTEE